MNIDCGDGWLIRLLGDGSDADLWHHGMLVAWWNVYVGRTGIVDRAQWDAWGKHL